MKNKFFGAIDRTLRYKITKFLSILRMKNVKEIKTSDRLVGGLNIRLRVNQNGEEGRHQVVVINLNRFGSESPDVMKQLCELITNSLSCSNNGYTKVKPIKRLFTSDGSGMRYKFKDIKSNIKNH